MEFDRDCPFCDAIQREDSGVREVYRDEYAVAFFPLEPATLGHTLVIPRKHVPDIWSLDEETAAHLARVTLRLSDAIRLATEPEGLNIIQSNGRVATQSVFHLHIHIVPRWATDELGRIWPPATDYSDAAKDAAWERIRNESRKLSTSPMQCSNKATADADDRRKHLEFIQAAVTRMSSASSSTKGWLLPVVTATYGYALSKKAALVALLGITAVALFALIDANYLRQDKAFRKLYDAVARNARNVPPFSLDPSYANDPVADGDTLRRKMRIFFGRWFPAPSVWLSWSIAPLYGTLTIVGCLIVLLGR